MGARALDRVDRRRPRCGPTLPSAAQEALAHLQAPFVPLHVPDEQAAPGPTHECVPGSQQPWLGAIPRQALPAAQHGSASNPHCWQPPGPHTCPPGQAANSATQLPTLQQPLLLQVPPAQHWVPVPPQPLQVPPAHTVSNVLQARPLPTQLFVTGSQQSPAVKQLEPAQQASPVAPHAAQVPATHARPPPVHDAPPQQGSPIPPHAVQVPPLPVHTRPGLVQVPPLQHGSPSPPQVAHEPFAQVRGPASPSGLHAALPAQQGSPLSPQPVHELFEQTVAAPASPGAHAAAVATHFPEPGSQQPLGHVVLAQQTSPAAPHAVHDPDAQIEAPPLQSKPGVTQWLVCGSQQPCEHVPPPSSAQQARFGVPQVGGESMATSSGASTAASLALSAVVTSAMTSGPVSGPPSVVASGPAADGPVSSPGPSTVPSDSGPASPPPALNCPKSLVHAVTASDTPTAQR